MSFYFLRSNVINSSSSHDSIFTSKETGKPSCPLRARLLFPYRHYRLSAPRVHNFDIQDPVDIAPNTNEPPSQRYADYRKVFFNCGLVEFLFVQPDGIPLLPFHCQPLLQRLPALSSHTKKEMLERAKSKPTSPKTRTRALFLQYLHRPLTRYQ